MMEMIGMPAPLAKIEGDEIVIRIPISALPHAASIAFQNGSGEENDGPVVIDANAFAGSLVAQLNEEDEIGDTMVHRMLDNACNEAADSGCEGLSE